jgi:beta-glucanase (GH16 family)
MTGRQPNRSTARRWIVTAFLLAGLTVFIRMTWPAFFPGVVITPTAVPTVPTLTPTLTPTPIPEPEGWKLAWNDEFDGPALDARNWTFDIGGTGWGNEEWQYYTNRPQNARLENGFLVIEARQEDYRGRRYTSARLKTQGLQSWTYGRMEARLKVPFGQGIWPAFWMLGSDIPRVGWPACGEIDIMENIGREPGVVHATLHGPGYSGDRGVTGLYTLPDGAFSDDFHTFAVEWEAAEIRWYLDGALYQTKSPADMPEAWVYDHPFFIILNVAVGGTWPGYPDETTVFPQRMLVDYVRVYQR